MAGGVAQSCTANEVAVGVAISVEGRGVPNAINLACATVDAMGAPMGAVRWTGGAPPAAFQQRLCAAGSVLTGFTGASGDIVDRISASCRPARWDRSAMRVSLASVGAASGTAYDRECLPGGAISSLTPQIADYFGAAVIHQLIATCRTDSYTRTGVTIGGMGGSSPTPFTVSCPAGQYAVGVQATQEGRGFANRAGLVCAPYSAGVFGATTSTIAGAPTAQCPAGSMAVGLYARPGEITDRIGAVCQPVAGGASTDSAAVPSAGMLGRQESPCPAGYAVVGITGSTVSYFGGSVLGRIEPVCGPLRCM